MVTLSGCERQRLLDRVVPVLLGLAEHAGDEVDVDLREVERARLLVGAKDLRRSVRPAVQLEHLVAEILDAEAQARDAEAADDRQLALGQRARLALEGHFLGRVPRRDRLQPVHQPLELARREKRRRAAAEIDEVERPAGDGRQRGVELPLANQRRRDTGRHRSEFLSV